jgi:AcrR family transcriptional regulator
LPPRKKASAGRGRGQRPASLTADEIIEVAAAIADSEGIDGLTMRRLAEDLDVAPAAIYWHVRTRDDVLRGILNLAYARMRLPDESTIEWDEQQRVLMRELRAALLTHPYIVELSQRFPSEGTARMLHATISSLLSAGFSHREAVEASFLLHTFASGFTYAEARAKMLRHDGGQAAVTPEAMAEWFRLAGPEGALVLPHFLSLDYDELFERGLEFQLEGLRTMLASSEAAAAKQTRRRA